MSLSFLRLDVVKRKKLQYMIAPGYFKPCGPFSSVNIDLLEYVGEKKEGFYTTFDDLFKMDFGDTDEDVADSLNILKEVTEKRIRITVDHDRHEVETLAHLAKKIFIPLFGEGVKVENKEIYYSLLGCDITAYLGMGSFDTFYGSPDMRLHGCMCLVMEDGEDGEVKHMKELVLPFVNVEGKQKILLANYPQFVATSIVSSFTACNTTGNEISCVPTILVNNTKFIFSVYDCNSDTFLLSEPIYLVDESNKYVLSSGLLALWTVVHYRHFMKPRIESSIKSSVLSKLKQMGFLDKYQQLTDVDINWNSKSRMKPKPISSERLEFLRINS